MILWIKRILIGFVALILLVLAGLFALTHFYEKEGVAIVTQAVNKQLNSPIAVSGVRLNLFRNFPNASIELQQPKVDGNNQPILALEALYLEFSLLDLIQKKIDIKKISLNGGSLFLEETTSGKWNFEIWNKSETGNSKVSFDIQEIQLANVQLNLQTQTDVSVNAAINQLDIISSNTFSNLEINGNLQVGKVAVGDKIWFSNVSSSLSSELAISKDAIAWKNAKIATENLEVKSTGDYQISSNTYNFTLTSNYADLSKLQAIPELENILPTELKREGTGKINGSISGGNQSIVALDMELKNSFWEINPDAKIGLNKLVGHLDYKNNNVTLLLNTYDVAWQNISVTGSQGKIIPGKTTTKIDLPNLELKNAGAKVLSYGNLALEGQIKYHGSLSMQIANTGNSLRFLPGKGTLYLTNFTDVNNPAWKINAAEIQRENLEWNTENFVFSLSGNTMDFSGGVYLSENLMQPKINLRGYLKAETIDLDAFTSNKKTDAKSNISIATSLDYYIKTIRKDNLVLTENLGKVDWDGGNTMNLQGFKTQVSGGSLQGDMQIGLLPNKQKTLSGDVILDEIDINSLFQDFDNFNQNTIHYSNLAGKLDAKLHFYCRLNNNLELELNTVDASGNVLLSKGALYNLPLFEDLAKAIDENLLANMFINVKRMSAALKKVTLENLSNSVVVRQGNVSFPKMEIKSDVFDLNISGTHNLDQTMAYRMDFLLADALRIGKEKSDGEGRRIFLKMYGHADDPEIELDREAAKAHKKNQTKHSMENLFSADNNKNEKPQIIIEQDSSLKPAEKPIIIAKETDKKKDKPKWLQQSKEEKTKVEIDFSDEDF